MSDQYNGPPPPFQPPGQPPHQGPPFQGPPFQGLPQPPQPPPKKKRTGLIVGIVVGAIVLVLGGCGAVGAVLAFSGGDEPNPTRSAPATTVEPTTAEPTTQTPTPEPTTQTPTDEPTEKSHTPATAEEKLAAKTCKKALRKTLAYPNTASFDFATIAWHEDLGSYKLGGLVTAQNKSGSTSKAFWSCTATPDGNTMRAKAKLLT